MTVEAIVELRVLVGSLGEKWQANWWGTGLLQFDCGRFSPIFTRSVFLAQYNGVTAAAAKVHDDVIGVGRPFTFSAYPLSWSSPAKRWSTTKP